MEVVQNTKKKIARIFLEGLIVVLPITLTLALIVWLAAAAEAFLGGLLQAIFPGLRYWAGLGTLIGIALVFAIGLLMNAWITRALLAHAESIMARIPFVKSVYGGLRDLAKFLSRDRSERSFEQVVAVTITDHVRLIGFVTRPDTNGLPSPLGQLTDVIGVYLPMSYQIGGYTLFVPKTMVEPIDMRVEDAMRFTLTAGMSDPGQLVLKAQRPPFSATPPK